GLFFCRLLKLVIDIRRKRGRARYPRSSLSLPPSALPGTFPRKREKDRRSLHGGLNAHPLPLAWERLSLWSSWLPRFSIPDDGIEDDEEFAGCCDDGDELWLA